MSDKKVNLEDLKQEVPVQWKVQSVSRSKPIAICVPYIDARDVMNVLDEVVGIQNWQDEYLEIHNNLYCKLSLKINGEWISKMGCGTESQTEKEKGEESDALKRAGVKFGIGRFCYDMEPVWIAASSAKNDSNRPYPVDDQGERIWDLTKHIRGRKDKKPGKKSSSNGKQEDDKSLTLILKKLVENKEWFNQIEENKRKSIEKLLQPKNKNHPETQGWIDFLTKFYVKLGEKDKSKITEKKITEAQLEELMTIAEKNNYTEKQLNNLVLIHKYESPKDILVKDYDKIVAELEQPF